MEIFEILQGLILSASIFSKMGTGSQSGKLLFKRLYGGDNILIVDGPTVITVSNTFNQCPVILDRVAMGTGDNITNSCSGLANINFYQGDKFFAWGKYLNNIENYASKTSSVFLDSYTGATMYGFANRIDYSSIPNMIISGSNNYLKNTINSYSSLILGGRNNYFGNGAYSVIIGGRGNKTLKSELSTGSKFDQLFVSITGGFKNCIARSELSTILGGKGNNISNSPENLIISGLSSSITTATTSLFPRQNIIVSGQNNSIYQGTSNITILSSCSVKIKTDLESPASFRTSGDIVISSNSSEILASSSVAYSSFNSLITGYSNKIINSNYNDIIGGCENCIYMNWDQDTSFISLKYNSIITSIRSCIQRGSPQSNDFTTIGYSTIISSYKSEIKSSEKNDEFKFISIIGGSYNCNYLRPSSAQRVLQSSIISGKNNIIQSRDDKQFSDPGFTYATTIGGRFLTASGGVLISGECNKSRTNYATIIGGCKNITYSKIIGGKSNVGLTPSVIIGSRQTKSLSGPDYSVHISGLINESGINKNGVILGGFENKLNGTYNSILLTGECNRIDAFTLSDVVKNSFIIGGRCNKFFSNSVNGCACQTYQSGIIGGCKNNLYKRTNTISNTVILGACGLSSSESNSMVVKDLWVTGTMSTGSPGHFTQSFTYSYDGLTGNFSNVNDIIFINGLVVGITTAPVVYNSAVKYKVNTSSDQVYIYGVSSSVILVNWGDQTSNTYSVTGGSLVTPTHNYPVQTEYLITIHGTFSGLTGSFFTTELIEFSQLRSISCNSSNLDTVGNTEFTQQTAWEYVNFNGSSLDLTSVNNILIALDAQATVPTYVGLSQSPAQIPTGAGSASRAQLIADGATVVTNWF